jgi:omega-hydroxy-beta-dihydromenaquinone-9 sulfotransferase
MNVALARAPFGVIGMIGFTLTMYARILASCLAVRGTRKALWIWLFLVPAYVCFTRLTLLMDRLVFPAYRRVEVRAPIFILGHPRSGTTFLQRLLTQTRDFAAFEAWEMAFPALMVRGLIAPLVRRLARRGKGVVVEAEIGHQVRVTEIDEDEALFYHLLDTEMITTISPIGFVDTELDRLLFHDRQPHEESAVRFFKDLWKRQLFHTGRSRLISKLPPSALRTKTLLKVFPDARIIYLARSPLDVIPSFLSLHRNAIQRVWGLDRLSEAHKRFFFERKYRVSVRWYRYFQELIERHEIPEDQLLEITYDEQIRDLRGTIGKIVAFTGIELSRDLQARIDEICTAPSSYQREHTNYSLEEFYLSEERIRADLKPIFDRYGFR